MDKSDPAARLRARLDGPDDLASRILAAADGLGRPYDPAEPPRLAAPVAYCVDCTCAEGIRSDACPGCWCHDPEHDADPEGADGCGLLDPADEDGSAIGAYEANPDAEPGTCDCGLASCLECGDCNEESGW